MAGNSQGSRGIKPLLVKGVKMVKAWGICPFHHRGGLYLGGISWESTTVVRHVIYCCLYLFAGLLLSCQNESPATKARDIVRNGVPLQTISTEGKWEVRDSFLQSGDPFDELFANRYILPGDFKLNARLTLERIDSSTALFLFFDHHFGFDSKPDEEDEGGRLFFYNPGNDQLKKLEPARKYIRPGESFDFTFQRKEGQFQCYLNEQLVFQTDTAEFSLPLEGFLAFRPGENVMGIYDWTIEGNTRSLPPLDFVFTAGEKGYVCFRIPAIIKDQNGDLLAFAEARKTNCWTDGRDIDIVMKRSRNNGKTWGPLQLIWDDGANTCSYPTPVLERNTGRLFLFACGNLGVDLVHDVNNGTSEGRRRVYVLHSDNGDNWSVPKELTDQVMLDSWSWIGTGSGSGIQLTEEPYRGRLVIPAHHRVFETKEYFAHVIYSDDYGTTWQLGEPTLTVGGNECQIVELNDGRLMMNMRNYNKSATNQRQVAISVDGGATWQPSWFDSTLVDPPCQGSLLMVDHPEVERGILLFANPPYVKKRADLTLRASLDEGKTWAYQKRIFDGATAYSDLVQIGTDSIGVLYEGGHPFPYQGLTFEVVELSEWLDL